MPTEVTTEMRQSMSRVADTSRVQQHKAVIEADKEVARQDVSDNDHSVPPTKESSQPSNQQLEQAAENLNKHVQNLKRDLHFSVDEDTGETVIRVVDSQSQKTIRTIPSDEFLSMSQQLNQTVGMLLNAQA
jgi:flagellar protein FlaG